jgi:acyl dehydratase
LFVVAPNLLSQLTEYSVIHGEQTFDWHGPLPVEADLHVSGAVTRVRERGGAYFVGFEMTLVAEDSTIASGTSLFLVSPTDAASSKSAPDVIADPLDTGEPVAGQRSASRSDLVRYAAATRDWNPIHWDHGSATAAGLPGVVVHGLLQTAWALDAAGFGVESDAPFSFAKIRFRNPLMAAHPVDVTVDGDDLQKTVVVSDADTQYLTAKIDMAEE